MRAPLLAAAAFSALAALQAVWDGGRPRRFLALKPLTTLLILAWALTAPPSGRRDLIAVGLGLGLIGDVFLLGQGDRPFLVGLGSFLLAHVAFVMAFLHGLPAGPPPVWALAVLAPAALALLAWLLPAAGKMKGPVAAYALVLVAMALAAAQAWSVQRDLRSALALAGAAAFLVSDSLLAADRFRGPLPKGQVFVLTSYWIAIGLIAGSA